MPTTYLISPSYTPVTQPRGAVVTLVTSDTPLSHATKSIIGTVYDDSNTVVVGATVELHRQLDRVGVAVTTSDGSGNYTFLRNSDDTLVYYTYAYSVVGGTIQVHGASDRDLVAS